MNKRLLYVAGFILAVFAVVFSACKQPTGSRSDTGYSYTVTFDKNHGDADGWTPADPGTITVASPKTKVGILPVKPERLNYRFTGWNTDRNGTGTPFTADTTVKANITVYAQWQEAGSTDPGLLTVELNISGNVEGDSVTLSPSSGSAGDSVTVNYTVAGPKINNRLVFSGTTPAVDPVYSSGSGTRTYVINEDDSADGRISINAVFAHSDMEIDTIAFADTRNEDRTYGDSPFTKAITNTGAGSGAISYSSGNPSVATVNSSTGEVTIRSAGSSLITAVKASDGTYDEVMAKYNLSVSTLQLSISAPTVTTTKTYDGTTTAAVVAGNLSNVVSGDTVNVTAVASYNSADVSSANLITVVYTITGASASNYTKPGDYTIEGSVTKAVGAALSVAPTAASVTHNRITVRAVTPPASGQTVEYAVSTTATPTPASGWQTATSFTGLTPETDYYIHARVQGNENCNEGPARVSAKITTPAYVPIVIPPVKVDFETDTLGKTYSATGGNGNATLTVIADPLNAGEKSLQINVTGYNRGAIIPIHLPYALQNYESFSFRINVQSGGDLVNKPFMVYAAGAASAFLAYGFGNPADSTYAQFAANLDGQTAAVDFSADTYKNTWTPFTITLDPGPAIRNLKGDIFIAIGINSNSANYLLDDLTFTIKSDFEPPVPIPAPEPPSVGAVASGNYRNLFEEMGKTEAEVNARVQGTWNRLFTGDETYRIYNPVGSDMAYILDSGADTPDVRSEGMSYGMMMAVQMDKQEEFDRLWKWARTYMYFDRTVKTDNVRGYFAWQMNTNGTVKDRNTAPDGEFYFVTALLFASARWGDGSGIFEYGREARNILYDMIHRDPGGLDNHGAASIFRTDGAGKYMPVFSTIGNAANQTDPSYHLPAFYQVWAIELERDADDGNTRYPGIWPTVQALRDDATFYKNAVQASRDFFPKTTHATTGLGPDYANFDGTATGGNHANFEYDAWRIAMNIAMDYAWWSADPWQVTFADRIQAFFHSKGVSSYTALWHLDGTPQSNPGDHSPGLVACNSVASLAATHERAWDFLENFWEISMTGGRYRYYDGCLYMLGLLHVTGNFKAYLSGGANYVPNSSISPTSATFDKREDLQKDIVITLNLNSNTLTGIKNGTTTLTSGTHYTVSGSTVTLKKEYLAGLNNGAVSLTFTFSAGNERTFALTVKTSADGATGGGTAFDFTELTEVEVEYVGTITATVQDSVLHVDKTGGYSSPVFILTFNLGTQTLNDFSGVKVKIRGVNGDTQNTKNLTIESVGANNARTALTASTGFSLNDKVWHETTISFTAPGATLSALTGDVKIAFGLNNTNAVGYEFEYIELVPK